MSIALMLLTLFAILCAFTLLEIKKRKNLIPVAGCGLPIKNVRNTGIALPLKKKMLKTANQIGQVRGSPKFGQMLCTKKT